MGAASYSVLNPVVYEAIFDRNKRVFERAAGTEWTGGTGPAPTPRFSARR